MEIKSSRHPLVGVSGTPYIPSHKSTVTKAKPGYKERIWEHSQDFPLHSPPFHSQANSLDRLQKEPSPHTGSTASVLSQKSPIAWLIPHPMTFTYSLLCCDPPPGLVQQGFQQPASILGGVLGVEKEEWPLRQQ